MKKILTLLLISICVSWNQPFTVAGEPDEKFHKECLYPSAMILAQCGPSKSIGSGVIVKSEKVEGEDKYINYVFTVAHVTLGKIVIINQNQEQFEIEPVHKIRIGKYKDWSVYEGFEEFTAEIIYANVEEDIALMKFESNKELPVAVLHKDPKLFIGDDIFRIGCGIGEPFRTDFGKINSLKESQDKVIHAMKGTYRITAPTLQGDSGGPVFYEYKVIGVAQAIRSLPGTVDSSPVYHMTYVIPIERFLAHEEIKKILD